MNDKSDIGPICDLVRECGAFIRNADRTQLHVDSKAGHGNFVTEYDKKVQQRLKDGLAAIMPDVSFIGEEGSSRDFSDTGRFFIVDPIDGTTNFIRDYHGSCISVALVADGKAELGVIYNPYLDEMYTAERGRGAYCNRTCLHVSSEPLENALVIFGTAPYREELCEMSFRLAHAYCRKAVDVRRSGSAALDLCAVAAGRADLFFELSLSPWDFAAGKLIVEEAGGIVTDIDGKELTYDKTHSVLARNKVVVPIQPPAT